MYKKHHSEPDPIQPDGISTKERLARDIEALAKVKGDEALGAMARRAREGYYDDFDSPLGTPCIQLVQDFRSLGYEGMAHKAMDGKWDSTKEESEAWATRQTDPEIVAALKLLKGA